ncbi:MAG: hypothetical protein LBM98_11725 [Oscillospiraceae bacterium]|jgi:hypothetical protein|nr:hypothetical protein [Oscillospiraceae bacterium]
MKYTIDKSKSGEAYTYAELTELGEGELYAEALIRIRKELGGKPVSVPFAINNQPGGGEVTTAWVELDKLGMSPEALSKAWDLPLDYMRATHVPGEGNLPKDFAELERRLIDPLVTLAKSAPLYARDPSELAYSLLKSLTDAGQLTLASAAKLSGVEESQLQTFFKDKNYDALTEIERYRLCVALLIADSAINNA